MTVTINSHTVIRLRNSIFYCTDSVWTAIQTAEGLFPSGVEVYYEYSVEGFSCDRWVSWPYLMAALEDKCDCACVGEVTSMDLGSNPSCDRITCVGIITAHASDRRDCSNMFVLIWDR